MPDYEGQHEPTEFEEKVRLKLEEIMWKGLDRFSRWISDDQVEPEPTA